MKCEKCDKNFDVIGAKYCPYCGKMIDNGLFTEEQDSFLKANKDVNRQTLADMFNQRFGTDKTRASISHRCARLGLRMSKEARYHLAYSRSKKLPIGTERFYKNCVWVKVSESNSQHPQSRYKDPDWKRKHYLVWENVFGKIPKGSALVFLDGDPHNCNIENLCCTSKENAIMVSNPNIFNVEHPETKKAAIAWGECYFASKE